MEAVRKYFADFKVLKETKREYWGLQVLNTLDCLAYFAIFNIVILSLSEDYGFTDINAGYIFTAFSSLTTIFLFFSGLFTDWLGIKKAIYTSFLGLLLTRLGVVVAYFMPQSMIRDVLVIVSLVLMAPFMAMIQTVFQAANKRFTTKKSRGAGFNLWYLFMNVGAAGGGFLVDIFYQWANLPRFHIFTFGVITAVICISVTSTLIKNTEQLYGEGEEPEVDANASKAEKQSPWTIARNVLKESVFWKFTLLITLLLGVRAVFLYMGLLMPKYWTRVIGPDASIGFYQALNPIIVIIGLIVFIPLLNRFHVYKMLVFGALITSLSMFIIAIPPMAGANVATWTVNTTIAFILVLTIGELIWSPRLQEYTAAIAPEGQEGTYLGLSMVPYFLAKTFVSLISGHMLARWCPAPPTDNPLALQQKLQAGEVAFVDSPFMMWLILALVALIGTLMAMFLKDWFTKGAKFEKSAGASH